ncbi:MAG: hypothetical protein ACKPH1_24825 [Microcystis panniformis]
MDRIFEDSFDVRGFSSGQKRENSDRIWRSFAVAIVRDSISVII